MGCLIQSAVTFKLLLMAQYSSAGDKLFIVLFGDFKRGSEYETNLLGFWQEAQRLKY